MFWQHLKISIRKLLAQKLFTSINIFGLAVGFAGSLLISVFIWNEISYESMHENRKNIYRVAVQFGKEDESMILPGAMPALGPAAKAELPEVKDFARIIPDRNATIKVGDTEFEGNKLFIADPSIFNLFTIEVTNKANESPLADPFDVLLAESTAKKYFGRTDVIGETVEYKGHMMQVTGIYNDVTGNTQINPALIVSYKSQEILNPDRNQWGTFGQDFTYLLLNQKMSAASLEEKIRTLFIEHSSPQIAEMLRFIPEYFLGIHLNSNALGDIVNHGNKSYVYLFATVALFVLLVASLNFINLSTARWVSRMKEVGIKKVLGAQRRQLVSQFLTESLLVTFLALALGIIIYELFYPVLNRFLEISVGINYLKSAEFYTIIGVTFLVVGLLSSLYPAFYLTGFDPGKAVKSVLGKTKSRSGLRHGMVVTQFVISILLIFGTTVIYRQLVYMQNYNIGIDTKNIVLLNYSPTAENADRTYEILKSRLLSSADVVSVSGAHSLPGLHNIEKRSVRLEDEAESENRLVRYSGVDYSFLKTFGLNLIAGRNFSKEYGTDADQAVILNEAAAKLLGEENIIGKQIGSDESFSTVIGVVRDFNIESLRTGITPLILYINPVRFYSVAVKISSGDVPQTLAHIKSVWSSVVPDQQFHYTFLEDTYNALYASEAKTSRLFGLFAVLALFIASLGLFGLASFTAERRRKEVGIRKVLGSTVSGVVRLITQDYLKMVIIAFVIAMPVSYYLMSRWLENFAYRAEIPWWMFGLSGGIALVVTIGTVSYHAIRSASINPADTLRYE